MPAVRKQNTYFFIFFADLFVVGFTCGVNVIQKSAREGFFLRIVPSLAPTSVK